MLNSHRYPLPPLMSEPWTPIAAASPCVVGLAQTGKRGTRL